MFPFDEKYFIEIERHHKCFFNKSIDKPKANSSLKLIFHVDDGYNLVHIIPDKGDYVSYEDEAFE